MTAASTDPDASLTQNPGPAARNDWARRWLSRAWIPALLGLLALLERAYSIQISGGFTSSYLNPDEGTYFGSSHALLNGLVPYRDFLLLHPPGSSIAYAPAAAMSGLVGEPNSFGLARLLVIFIGAANTILVCHVASRVGKTAAISAGLMYALWFPALRVERTTLLEPLVNLALLGSLAMLNPKQLTSRRLVLAGAILGLGMSVKLWAVFPIAVLCIWLLVAHGRRKAAWYMAGAAGGFAVVMLPFFIAAPSQMLRMVVFDQAGRSGSGVSTIERLSTMVFAGGAPGNADAGPAFLWILIAIAAVLVAWKLSTARPWVALLVVIAGLLLATPTFFVNYTAFLAVPLALVAGSAAQLAAGVLTKLKPALMRPAAACAIVVGIAALLILGSPAFDTAGSPFPVNGATNAVARAQCLTSDSTTAIILTGSFAENVDGGCPIVVDMTGYVYETRGLPTSRARNPEWQAYALRYLHQGDYVIIMTANRDGFTDEALQDIARRPVVFKERYVTIYGPLPSL